MSSSAILNKAEVKALRSYAERRTLELARECSEAVTVRVGEERTAVERRQGFEELAKDSNLPSFEATCAGDRARMLGAAEVLGALEMTRVDFRSMPDPVFVEIDFTQAGASWVKEEGLSIFYLLEADREGLEINGGAPRLLFVNHILNSIERQFEVAGDLDRLRAVALGYIERAAESKAVA